MIREREREKEGGERSLVSLVTREHLVLVVGPILSVVISSDEIIVRGDLRKKSFVHGDLKPEAVFFKTFDFSDTLVVVIRICEARM